MGLGGVRIARRICICREGLLVGGGLGGRKLGGVESGCLRGLADWVGGEYSVF